METNTPKEKKHGETCSCYYCSKEKCVCAGKLKDPKTVHTKENCYVIPHQPDSMEWEKIAAKTAVDAFKIKSYREFSQTIYEAMERVQALSRAEGWKDLMHTILPLIEDIIKREDKRSETSARYNRPFDATVKSKALTIKRFLIK